jgi:cell division initiation protein
MADRLTAMDVEQQQFGRALRGYDAEAVRLYLRSVAEEIGRLHLDNGRLLEENGALRRELDELRGRERTLQQTLVSAQGFSDELKDRARREAELVVQEARQRADDVVRASQQRLVQLEADVSRIQMDRELIEGRLRTMLEQHLSLIGQRRDEPEERDNLRVLSRRSGTEVG